jgi:hypothetical protein
MAWRLAVVALLLLPVSGAQLPSDDASDADGTAAENATLAAAPEPPSAQCRGAPCGFVTPILDLHFPDKPFCGANSPILSDEARKDCLPMLALGESLVLEGTVSWSWQFSDEGTYPNDPNTDIVIRFPRNERDPQWMQVTVEPAQFVISTATLMDPRYLDVDESDPTRPVIWYRYEGAITATLTRTADPTPEQVAEIMEREPRGIVKNIYVRATSNESGSYFTRAFGLDPVRFDYETAPAGASNDKPSPLPVVAWLPLVLLAMARRLAR